MWLVGGIIGLIVGASIFGESGWLLGAILGAIAGVFVKRALSPDLTEIKQQPPPCGDIERAYPTLAGAPTFSSACW